MLVRSKKKKKILLKWENIVFQFQIPKLIIFMYLICTSKKLIPIICLYTVNTCMIAAMFTALLYFLQWKKFLRKKKSTLQLSFLCSRVLQTLHRHQTTLCNVRTAERMEDSTEGNFPLTLLPQTPRCSRGLFYFGLHALEKLNIYTSSRQTYRIPLTIPLQTPSVRFTFQWTRRLKYSFLRTNTDDAIVPHSNYFPPSSDPMTA